LKLIIVGRSFEGDAESSEDEIRAFIEASRITQQVQLLGGRSDVPDLLRCMDIFCLTSYQEGLPISLIEAMATAMPVVGTDIEAIRKVILDEENGFVIPLNDVSALFHALERLITDPILREDFGLKSREIAKQRYSMDTCIGKYQTMFS